MSVSSAGFWIACGVFRGAYVGAPLAGTVSTVTMKRLYALFLLAVAIYFLVAPEVSPARPVDPGWAKIADAQTVHCPPDLSS
jgi:uncharacterized membrane protein YfcA